MTSEITGKWYNWQNIWVEYQYKDLFLIYKKSQVTFFIENSCSIIYNKITAVIHKMNEW